MTDSTPEDSEPTSFAEKAKDWYGKHKPKIRIFGAATLTAGLAVVAHIATRQDTERYDAEDIADSEPVSDRETTSEPHRPPSAYDVDPHLRKLPKGQSPSAEKKAQYKGETGDGLPPDHTWVDGWSFLGDSPEDEDSGEAAA
ncbi:hypothetical protein ABZ338_18185 [Streptomyces albidoflavus]|uniref:hypothetical protein n=1 Tax=Streptomyces albidoflavus TaxID=1886 RepID=UPI0033F6D6D0